MKATNAVFWLAVAGVVISFGGSIYTGIRNKKIEKSRESAPLSIPTPAMMGAPQGVATPATPGSSR